MRVRIPVIAITGYLGAGKTTVLNRLLATPGARLGVVVNDFGAINVDAALVSGQVDQPASITGGCLCCLPDSDGLDQALKKLSHPRLRLDAVIVEASGVADPPALSRLIRLGGVDRVRPGGLIDVIDAASYFDTVDRGGLPPARFASASLVLINKIDRLPPEQRAETVARIASRVRASNPHAHIVETTHGRIDPALVFDTASTEDPVDELPLAALARHDHDHEPHPRVDAVTVAATGPVDPGPLADLIENPPANVYRLKGTVTVATGRGLRGYVVNVVGRDRHVATWPDTESPGGLVAIGMGLDEPAVRARLETVLAPCAGRPALDGVRRIARLRRLSA